MIFVDTMQVIVCQGLNFEEPKSLSKFIWGRTGVSQVTIIKCVSIVIIVFKHPIDNKVLLVNAIESYCFTLYLFTCFL